MPDVVNAWCWKLSGSVSPQSKHPEIFQDKGGVNKCLPAKDNRILLQSTNRKNTKFFLTSCITLLSWFLVIPFLELSKILQCELKLLFAVISLVFCSHLSANTSTFFASVGYACAQSLQSCPTVCDPMDYSLLGSSVSGILHARILEWVPMPSTRGSSQPKEWTCVSCISSIAGRIRYPLNHLESQIL